MTVRSHGRILVSILRDAEFIALDADAQRMYFILLAQKDITNAGVMPWMPAKWARSCHETTVDSVIAACEKLQAARFVFFDDDTDELLIRTFIKNDGIVKQPNVLKNALRAAEQIDSTALRGVLAAELVALRRADCAAVAEVLDPGVTERFSTGSAGHSKDQRNPSATHAEPFGIPLTLPEGFPKPCGVGDGDGDGAKVSSRGSEGGSRAHTRVSAREATFPLSPRCNRHRDDPQPPPCGACRDARLAFDAAQKLAASREAEQRAEARDAQIAATRAEIDGCGMCDDRGYRDGRVCSHDPDEDARRKRGLSLVQNSLDEARKANQ